MPSPKMARKLDRAFQQRRTRLLAASQNAAVTEKRHGDKEIAEEPAFHPRQRQNPLDTAVAKSSQIIRLMSQGFFDHVFPDPAMIVLRVRGHFHIRVPKTRIFTKFHVHTSSAATGTAAVAAPDGAP